MRNDVWKMKKYSCREETVSGTGKTRRAEGDLRQDGDHHCAAADSAFGSVRRVSVSAAVYRHGLLLYHLPGVYGGAGPVRSSISRVTLHQAGIRLCLSWCFPVSGGIVLRFYQVTAGSRMLNSGCTNWQRRTKVYSKQDMETILHLEDEHRSGSKSGQVSE